MSLTLSPAEIVARAESTGNAGLLAIAPGWPRVRLGDVAAVVNGAAYPSSAFNTELRGMPLIRIRDVGADRTATWFDGPWETKHLVRDGDILVGMDGDFRVARWRGGDALLNQRVCRIDVDAEVYEPRFLALVLQGYLDAIWAETSSVTVKHLSSRSIADIPLPHPSRNEQRQIVALLEDHLSRLDVAVESIRESLRRLDVLRWLLVDQLAHGDAVPLKHLAVESGYGTSVKCAVGGAGPAVVRIPNLVDGRVNLADEKRAVDPTVDLSSAMLASGDVLIIRTNGSKSLIGRSAVVQEGVNAAFASYLIRYRVDAARIRPAWFHAMLGSPAVRVEIERLAASSAGQHNLSLGKLNGLHIPTPGLDEQDVGLARLAELDEHLDALRQVLNETMQRGNNLRHALLGAAFSGRLMGSDKAWSEVEETMSA